jgi:hypothetical protein
LPGSITIWKETVKIGQAQVGMQDMLQNLLVEMEVMGSGNVVEATEQQSAAVLAQGRPQ